MYAFRRWLGVLVAAVAPGAALVVACSDSGTPNCTPGLVVVDGKCVRPSPDAGTDGGHDAAPEASMNEAGPDGSPDAEPDAAPDAPAGGPAFAGVTSVSPASPTSLLVTWAPAADPTTSADEMEYSIYVASTSMGEVYDPQHATQVLGGTSNVVTAVAPGAKNCVVVRATNKAKLQEQNTHEICVDAKSDTMPPAFPADAGATAVPLANCGATISWSAANDDLTDPLGISYAIYLADPGVDAGAALKTTEPGVTSATVTLTDADAAGSPYHTYQIVAIDAAKKPSSPLTAVADQNSVLFSQSIQPLVASSCAPSCHTLNTTNKLTPIMDVGYAYDSLTGDGTPVAAKVCLPTNPFFCTLDAGDCSAWQEDGGAEVDLVVPKDPGCSVFYQVLHQTKMPPGVGAQPAPKCSAQIVHDWILAGAPKN